jgi:hypothetical protein
MSYNAPIARKGTTPVNATLSSYTASTTANPRSVEPVSVGYATSDLPNQVTTNEIDHDEVMKQHQLTPIQFLGGGAFGKGCLLCAPAVW